MKIKLLLAVCLLACSGVFAQPPAFITDSLDSYIQQGMKDWQVPGLAIVIVKDGKIVTLKGYGVKDIQTGQPVDEHTLFMIASTRDAGWPFSSWMSLNTWKTLSAR